MSKIHYRCDATQRNKPLAMRTHWDVMEGTKCIATINTQTEPSSERSHSLRIWRAKVNGDVFDPFDFQHLHEGQSEDEMKQPYVRINNNSTELINPQSMTMSEARSWIKQVVLRGSNEN